MSVNIYGVNKALLLRGLWDHAAFAQPHGSYDWFDRRGPTEAQCEELVKAPIGWVCGVHLEIDLTRNIVNTKEYDRQTYLGCFRRVLERYIEPRRSPRLRAKIAAIAGNK